MNTSGPERTRVLFLCTGNSARSQMAEALLRARASRTFEAWSAGVEPAQRIHPLAREILRRAGLPVENLRPKPVAEVASVPFDLVVTVCDHARQTCAVWPKAAVFAHWPLEDPADPDIPEIERRGRFDRTFSDLAERIERLAELPDRGITPESLASASGGAVGPREL